MTTVRIDPDRVATATFRNGGGTFAAIPGLKDPTSGFAVAHSGHEVTVSVAGLSPLQRRLKLADAVAEYASVDGKRAWLAQTGFYLGTWVPSDRATVVLDVVEIIKDRGTALETAARRGEEAVYDLGAHQTIYV